MNFHSLGKSKNKSNFFVLGVGLCFFGSAIYLHSLSKRPPLFISQQESAVNFNTNFLKFASMGNKRMLSDLIYIQTLMDSDNEHYQKKDLNNWMFLRFNNISKLDPLFYENYLFGSQFLFVVKDDLLGASILFEEGLKHFPNDYKLNYYYGIMSFFEMGESQKGIYHLEKIQHYPKAPAFLPSIIAKLKLDTGESLENVFKIVQYNYESTGEENLKNKLKNDLYAIKAEMDLKCLNNKGPNCSRLDFYGQTYIFKGGLFHSQFSFKPYRIKKRGENPPSSDLTTTIK